MTAESGERRGERGIAEAVAFPLSSLRSTLSAVLPAVLGLIAALLALWLTQSPGPGLDPDSMSYLGAAQSIAQGNGIRVPIAPWASPDSSMHLKAFPPGNSLVLAIPIRLGAEPFLAGRVVQAVAAGATVTVLATLALEIAGLGAAILVGVALVMTPALVEDFLSILSEPLYLMLVALFLVALVRRQESPLLHGILAALGASARYLGGSLTAAAVFWALLHGKNRGDRTRRAIKAAVPTVVFALLWVIDARGGAGRPPAASLIPDFHLAGALEELRDAALYWLGPRAESVGANVGLLVVMTLLGGWLSWRAIRHIEWRRWPTDALPALWLAAVVVIICHLGVLLFSRVFVGHEIPFDGRLLSAPIMIAELLFAVTVAGFWLSWRWPQRVAVGAMLLWWVSGARSWNRERIEDARTNGWDYNEIAVRESPLVAWARAAKGRTLYTNHPVPLWFHAGRFSRDLPQSATADTVAAFARSLAAGNGAVIVFADTTWEPGVPIDSLVARVPLREVVRYEDGTVYER